MCKITLDIQGDSERVLTDLSARLGIPRDELATVAATTFLEMMGKFEAESERRMNARIEQGTPTFAQLAGSLDQNQPPREWFDSDDDPTTPG